MPYKFQEASIFLRTLSKQPAKAFRALTARFPPPLTAGGVIRMFILNTPMKKPETQNKACHPLGNNDRITPYFPDLFSNGINITVVFSEFSRMEG
jgi:hypothetical protein